MMYNILIFNIIYINYIFAINNEIITSSSIINTYDTQYHSQGTSDKVGVVLLNLGGPDERPNVR